MPVFTVVNIIPRSLSGETNQDSEPNLAVNPSNPLQLVASAFTPNPAGSGDAPIYVSADGGNTWTLQAIVPSDQITADITVRFGGNGSLYAGILRTPITQDPQGNPTPTLNILRTGDILSSNEMTVLVSRTGAGVDQPYIQATAVGGNDVVFCGNNDFNQQPQTANMDFSPSGASDPSRFNTAAIDARAGEGDAPSIRPAIHSDGTAYGAFLSRVSGQSNADLHYDVVVVRDDSLGTGSPPFASLLDSGDGKAGQRVAQNRLIPFLSEPILGQERIGSTLTIAVDPRPDRSGTVYVAWADRVSSNDYTIHLVRSSNRGAIWSADLLTITNATNPAVAINSDGVVAFVYQQLTGPFQPGKVSAANRWETHFRTSSDNGATWTDQILCTTPANQPPNPGPDGQVFLPYLGDYLHLMALDQTFYGIFSANNTPDPSNFPAGVSFQRNCDLVKHMLFDVDGVTPVDVSIDPFFFKVAPSGTGVVPPASITTPAPTPPMPAGPLPPTPPVDGGPITDVNALPTVSPAVAQKIKKAAQNPALFQAAEPAQRAPAPILLDQPGKERWPVKTGQDRDRAKVGKNMIVGDDLGAGIVEATIEELIQLPRPPGLEDASLDPPQFVDVRDGVTEVTIWRIEATIIALKHETDGDYHLVLQGASGAEMVGEIPTPTSVFVGDSPWLANIGEARSQIDDKLVKQLSAADFTIANGKLVPHGASTFQPSVAAHIAISLQTPPRGSAAVQPLFATQITPTQARITGVGFFDRAHGATGAAPNVIELHPVLKVEWI